MLAARRQLCFAATLACPFLPALAAADEPAIRWVGPDECSAQSELELRVQRLLGGSQRAASVPYSARITVRKEGEHDWRARIETEIDGQSGQRMLSGESCSALVLASAVVLAFAVDAEAAGQNLGSEAAPSEKPGENPAADEPVPAAPAHERVARPSAVTAEEPAEGLSPYVRASFGVLFELLPPNAASFGAGGGLRFGAFSLDANLAYHQRRTVTIAGQAGAGAELQLASANLVGCYALLRGSAGSVAGCLGVELEYLRAQAFGVRRPEEGSVLLAAGLLGSRAKFQPIARLATVLEAGLGARPFYPTFVMDGLGDVFTVPILSYSLHAGLELEF